MSIFENELTTSLVKEVNERLKETGLDTLNPEFFRVQTERNGYSMYFSKQFKFDYYETKLNMLDEIIKQVIHPVINSKFVQERLCAKDKEIKELQAENAELLKFKTYYEMQLVMNHGKDV